MRVVCNLQVRTQLLATMAVKTKKEKKALQHAPNKQENTTDLRIMVRSWQRFNLDRKKPQEMDTAKYFHAVR